MSGKEFKNWWLSLTADEKLLFLEALWIIIAFRPPGQQFKEMLDAIDAIENGFGNNVYSNLN